MAAYSHIGGRRNNEDNFFMNGVHIQREMLDMVVATDADTGYLHEGFDVDCPNKFTREWFTWPNSLFAEFIEACVEDGLI